MERTIQFQQKRMLSRYCRRGG